MSPLAINAPWLAVALSLGSLLLIATVVVGLLRALRGPTLEDRLLAAMLLGTGGVALLVLLSLLFASAALRDVALLLALLAAVVTAAMTGQGASRE